ncbi:hypothetical protein ABZ345_34200 [Lentzea sp. NPDC005914]|uniref:hypothetical protein n=1 Tax=Lentzea sp. NPDC005914 TaxID=3154572 RepID=UPI0033D547CB
MRTLLALAAACLAAACSISPQPATETSVPATMATSSTSSADRCQQVAQEDQPVTDTLIDKGCTDDKGALRFGKIALCKDGRRLWETNDLIGFSGELIFSRETKADGGIPVSTLHYRVCKG